MPAAIGPRFVLEAGFLVLLAVVVGIADLDPLLIVLVMAVGWLLVSLIEYFAWRQQGAALRRFEAAPAPVMEEEVVEAAPPPPPPAPAPPPAMATEEEVVEDVPPPPPPARAPEPAAPPEEETIVHPAVAEEPETVAEEPETVAEADERVTAARKSFADTAAADRTRFALDPLQPRPRRRWILFGPHERREAPAGDDSEEER
jgi:outer membrane biosynthesis protein TonB